jgi:hypothetical protein
MLDEFFHLGSFVAMSDSPQKISRQELYEKIWATPIVKLGKELGYSYLEMVQLCEKLNIPRPDGGYWYRQQHGGSEERVALPTAHPNTPLGIELGPRLKDTAKSTAEPADTNHKNVIEDVTQNQPNPPTISHEAAKASEPPTVKPIKKREAVEKSVVSKVEREGVESAANEPAVIQFTRRELYDAVWSKTCQKLAADLGISDVGLAKTCKRMAIPRPSLGYWARVAVGEKVPKTPLPDSQAGQDKIVTFDVAANRKRREEWRSTNNDVDSLAVDLALPPEEMELHPVAQRHLRALEKHKPGEDGCVNVNARDLFRCNVTPAIVNRLCRALHAILMELEARGCKLKSGSDQFSSLQIVKGTDVLSISCSESREQIEHEPTQEEKRKPSWTWQLKETRLTGRLSFEVSAPGLRGRRTWTESDSKPLEEVLGIVVEKVEAAFRGFEDQRQWAIEAAKRREEEAKRAAEEWDRKQKEEADRERKRRHEAKLAEVAETRRDNLFDAAHAWMESGLLHAYVDERERRWREKGELSSEQSAWITWARAEAMKLNPQGYPDPAADGRFDPSTVPVGGPYPKIKPIKERKAPEPVQPEVRTVYVEQPYQYPYWIKNRRR